LYVEHIQWAKSQRADERIAIQGDDRRPRSELARLDGKSLAAHRQRDPLRDVGHCIQLLTSRRRRVVVQDTVFHQELRTGKPARSSADDPLIRGPVSQSHSRLKESWILVPKFDSGFVSARAPWEQGGDLLPLRSGIKRRSGAEINGPPICE